MLSKRISWISTLCINLKVCYLALSGAINIIWQIIPPGMEFNHITIHDGDVDGESEGTDENSAVLDPPIWSEVSYLF